MKVINLESFRLEEINIRKQEHLDMIKQFDGDSLVKQYLYPYKSSFYELVCEPSVSDDIFNTFYVVYHLDKVVGYIEIGKSTKTELSSAMLRSERNKGYAKLLLKELCDYLLNNYSSVKSVDTIIRKDNFSSINAVKSVGLVKVEEDSKFETYRKTR